MKSSNIGGTGGAGRYHDEEVGNRYAVAVRKPDGEILSRQRNFTVLPADIRN